MVIITFNANRERTSSLVIYWKVLCGKASTYVIVPLIHLIIDHHLHILEHKTQPTSTNPIHQSWLFGELHLMIWFWIRNISVWAVIECDDWRNNHSFFSPFDELKIFRGIFFQLSRIELIERCQNEVMDSCLSKFNGIESVPWLHGYVSPNFALSIYIIYDC